MKIEVPSKLIKLIKENGSPLYLVGGYVRNALAALGKTDVDLAGVGALNLPKNYRTKVINYRLGTVEIAVGDERYEYTPFRTETYVGGEHTPREVFFTTDMKSDALRRDFTCNSIYYDPIEDRIFDFFNGVADIERKVIRAYNPEKVFACDGLRLLRLVRIAAETGFKLDGDTAAAAQKNAHLLADISGERKRDELNKMLVADLKYGVAGAHYRALKLMDKLGLTRYVLPALAECAGVEQNPAYHKFDVLEHTLRTVRAAEPQVRLAALMHDLGKVYCFKKYGNMHGHEKSSEFIARSALGSYGLRYPNDVADEVAKLCAFHMYDMQGNASEAKVRLFIAENWDIIDKLVMLIKADRAATGFEHDEGPHRFETIKQQMLMQDTPIWLSELAIGGEALVELGFKGEQIGKALKCLHRECILNPRLNNPAWLIESAKKLAEKKGEPC